MAYTSPSSISSSTWVGPDGSPIISPSNWQAQVVSNLCVLALHDHSASAGEGASSLSSCLLGFGGMQEYISPFFPSGSTNWSLDLGRTGWGGGGAVSTSTNGASISYDVYFNPGVHGVQFFYGKGSAFGIVTATLSGASTVSSPSSIDAQVAGAEQPPTGSTALTNMGTFNFNVYTVAEQTTLGSAVTGSLVGSGRYTLTFKVSGSNASSTGYIARLGYMVLT